MCNQKKLSNLDSERENIPISQYELTKALEETKLRSSPALDGYTYSVLKLLWLLIGHPHAKGFEVMVEKEELYPNLITASMKLILVLYWTVQKLRTRDQFAC